MKSKIIKAVIAGLIVVGVGFGGYLGYKAVFAKKPDVAAAQYITATASKMNLEVTIQGTGSAYASTTKEVGPNNNGTLKDLGLKIGDKVTEGQKLFTSYSDEVNSAVTNAQNNLNEANLNLKNAQSELTSAQNELAAAQAVAASAQSTAEEQSAEDKSSTGNSNSQGSGRQSTKSIESYKLAVEKAKASVEQAKLKVTDAKSKLSDAKSNVSKMTVTAPIGGVVTAVNNTNGDSVQNGKAVLNIVDMSAIKVKVAVDELDITKVKTGQKAQVKFDAIEDKTYEGTVEQIAEVGTSSNNVTTYDVVVQIANPEGIKLGMNANVTIQVESKENALVIPAEALVETNGKKYVRVAEASNSSGTGTNAAGQIGQGESAAPVPNTQTSQGENNNSGKAPNGKSAQTTNDSQGTRNRQNQPGTRNPSSSQASANVGRLVEIKTGMENENYIEVTEGLSEGQKVVITLPQTSTTNINSNRNSKNSMGGFGGGMPAGGMQGGGFPKN